MLGVKDLGAVIFFRKERIEIQTQADVHGKVFAANHENDFTGYHTTAREVTSLGFMPKEFFRAIHFVGQDQLKVLEEVADGRADTRAVKICLLEFFVREHLRFRDRF